MCYLNFRSLLIFFTILLSISSYSKANPCFEIEALINLRNSIDPVKEHLLYDSIVKKIKKLTNTYSKASASAHLSVAISNRFKKIKNGLKIVNNTKDQALAKFLKKDIKDASFVKENPTFTGGESKVYLSKKNPGKALKVWVTSRMDQFESSVQGLAVIRDMAMKNPSLHKHLHVTKIFEQGKGYIIREYISGTKELSKAIAAGNPDAIIAYNSLTKSLKNEKGYLNQKIHSTLKKLSDNFHWDPKMKKIVLFDTPGF